MPRFLPTASRLAHMIDKAFLIMLSVVLIWPQMVWAMQDSQDGNSARRLALSNSLLPSTDIAQPFGGLEVTTPL